MKRTFKTLFCVLTICAMVSFFGCGKKDKDDKDGASNDTKTSQDADKKEGSDAK